MWDLVGNPEDRFSQNEAQLMRMVQFMCDKTGLKTSYLTGLSGTLNTGAGPLQIHYKNAKKNRFVSANILKSKRVGR